MSSPGSKTSDGSKAAFQSANDSKGPLERVHSQTLPEESKRLIDSYEDVVGDRDRFLWKWAHELFPKFTLSCVAPEHVEEIQNTKLAGLMFVSILDDVAEMHQDRATFEEAAKIPFDRHTVDRDRDGVDCEILAFSEDVWTRFSSALDTGPRADEFEDIIRFDLKQVLDAMDYSFVANQHLEFITETELQTYDAHNMMLYGFADVDLVHSPTFDRSELSILRRVLERAQRMVRIGNWITTWQRELAEGDFTSGIVARALEDGIVSADELRASQQVTGTNDVEAIRAAIQEHDVEAHFLRQWDDELAEARKVEGSTDSVDLGTYLDGIETIMDYHLASRGLK